MNNPQTFLSCMNHEASAPYQQTKIKSIESGLVYPFEVFFYWFIHTHIVPYMFLYCSSSWLSTRKGPMTKGYANLNWASHQFSKKTSTAQQLNSAGQSADLVKSLSLDYVDVTDPWHTVKSRYALWGKIASLIYKVAVHFFSKVCCRLCFCMPFLLLVCTCILWNYIKSWEDTHHFPCVHMLCPNTS